MKIRPHFIVIVLLCAVLLYLLLSDQKGKVTRPQKLRGQDAHGSGHYLASRGAKKHMGVDLVVTPGQNVFAPFSGVVKRLPFAYSGDSRYKGVEIVSGERSTEIYYMEPTVQIGQRVRAGQKIGTAQNIAEKYSAGMTPHLHVEIMENGQFVDPTNLLKL